MGTWLIENKTKILNLLGLRENPGIRFPYEFAHSLRLVTLIKNNNENNNNVTKLKQTNKQTNSHFQNAEANCETFPIKTSFLHENYNNFHINIFALSFALKQRLMTLLRVELCRCCIELHRGGGLGKRSLLSLGTLKSSDETATRTSL